MEQKITERTNPFLLSVSKENPEGQDARYTDAFENVRQEISKLESPTPSDVRWEVVVQNCEHILKAISKDILVASQLAFAWYCLEGPRGCSNGLALITRLFQTFENQIFPKRDRAKTNALTWLIDQINNKLEDYQPKLQEKEEFLALQKQAKLFSDEIRKQLQDHAPALSPLKTNIEKVLQTFPAETAKSLETAQSVPQKPTDTANTSASTNIANPNPHTSQSFLPTALSDLSKSQSFLRKTSQQLIETGAAWMMEDDTNPKGISLWLTGLFLSLEQLPQSDSTNKTSLTAPTPALEEQIRAQIQNQKWEAAWKQSLWAIEKQRLFLDYYFFLNQILENLGATHSKTQKAFQTKLSFFVLQHPTLPQLKFADGKPWASALTQQWLEKIIPQKTVDKSHQKKTQHTSKTQQENKTLQKALSLFPKNPESSVSLFQSLLEQSADVQERFKILLTLADTSLEINNPPFTESLFLELQALTQKHHLEQWDTKLCTHFLQSYHRFLLSCAQSKTKTKGSAEEVFEKLCRLSPASAIEITLE